MGKGKPLFEILQEQKAQQGGQLSFSAPSRKPAEASIDRQPPEQTQPEPTLAAEQASADLPHDDQAGTGTIGWLREPVAWRLPRAAVGIVAASLVALLGVSFGAGQWMGKQSATAEQQEYHAAAGSLQEMQQEPTPGLLPPELGGVGPHSAGYSMGDGQPAGDDPRLAGLNYFRLIEVPASSGEEIYRIVDFLRDHEVDAAVVSPNNGRLKVVALPGFERPRSDARAEQFRDKLLRLGRKWEAEHNGSTDWRDLMAEKYRPGIN